MSYFEDILDEDKKRMGYDFYGDQFKDRDFPLTSLKFRGKLQDGTKMNQKFQMKSGKPAGYR